MSEMREIFGLTMQKPVIVEDLDHRVSLQFADARVVLGVLAAPEDSALTQAFDEDALAVGT